MDSFLSLFEPEQCHSNGKQERRSIRKNPSGSSSCSSIVSLTNSSNSTSSVEDNGNSDCSENLPPEPQQGNIEYKLKLINPSNLRLEHLVTQMKWRLREGGGEAIYEIGVEDSGFARGLCPSEMDSTMSTIEKMAARLGATTMVLREIIVRNGRSIQTILIRKIPDDQQMLQITVAVMGNVDVGKSTLLGVLIQGEFDDGKGKARLNMLRHRHEIESGRTSSINHELLGFDPNGNAINYQEGTPETICELSSKIVTLIDLAGHEKYLKTTIHGVTGYSPHYLLFVVSASVGFTKLTKEHLTLALALEIPLVVVVSKVDICTGNQIKNVIASVSEYCAAFGKRITKMSDLNDVVSVCSHQPSQIEIPLFLVSSVTGAGIDLLKKLLFLLPSKLNSSERHRLEQEPLEFQIDETFRIPDVGIVLGGLLTKGIVKEGTSLLLGPFSDGNFKDVTVKSIRRHKISQNQVKASQAASLTLSELYLDVRPGMFLLSKSLKPTSSLFFEANIRVIYHSCVIRNGFQAIVHIGNVRQTVIVHLILPSSQQQQLATNDEASVIFRFLSRPEYLKVGSRLLFRAGKTKGHGTITKIFRDEQELYDFS